MTCQRSAAEESDQRAFFVGKVHRFDLDLEPDPVFFDRSQHFKRRHHTECAIEASAFGDGVEVGTENKSRRFVFTRLSARSAQREQ